MLKWRRVLLRRSRFLALARSVRGDEESAKKPRFLQDGGEQVKFAVDEIMLGMSIGHVYTLL
jgi:hypothetical protein